MYVGSVTGRNIIVTTRNPIILCILIDNKYLCFLIYKQSPENLSTEQIIVIHEVVYNA